MQLILASNSPFRKQILQKLLIPFNCQNHEVDETPLDNETAQNLVKRLSKLKADTIAKNNKNCLVIGSDQVVSFANKIIGKPQTKENAIKQLRLFSGNYVTFYTGLCLLNSKTNTYQSKVVPFSVEFRVLSDDEIRGYLSKEKTLNCAGSFKSERLGIALFKKLIGDDPNTLIGLPLIELSKMLKNEGMNPLTL